MSVAVSLFLLSLFLDRFVLNLLSEFSCFSTGIFAILRYRLAVFKLLPCDFVCVLFGSDFDLLDREQRLLLVLFVVLLFSIGLIRLLLLLVRRIL